MLMIGRERVVALDTPSQMCSARCEMQIEYYEKTARFLERRGADEVSKTLLEEWRLALEALSEDDPERLGRKVDWVTKRLMIERGLWFTAIPVMKIK